MLSIIFGGMTTRIDVKWGGMEGWNGKYYARRAIGADIFVVVRWNAEGLHQIRSVVQGWAVEVFPRTVA